MRIAILPSRGDPFTLMLPFYFFEKVWQDEVDKFFVLVNTPEEKEVVDFIEKTVMKNPKVVFKYVDHPTDHGNALTMMIKESKEDIIIFLEDDSIVFKKGIIDEYCKKIESGEVDCVGSLRWSCAISLIDITRKAFNLHEDKYAVGGNYWPCFFFARRSDLLKTDLDFGGRNFKAGEYIKPLQTNAPEDVSGDTFVWMSWQLRALGLKFLDVEQYHGNSNDLIAYGNKTFLFDGICPWLHNGTLSSAIEDIFTDEGNVPLARRKDPSTKPYSYTNMPAEKEEMERRIAWAVLAVETFWDKLEEIAEFRNLYKKAVDKYISIFSLDIGRIDKMVEVYKELIGI